MWSQKLDQWWKHFLKQMSKGPGVLVCMQAWTEGPGNPVQVSPHKASHDSSLATMHFKSNERCVPQQDYDARINVKLAQEAFTLILSGIRSLIAPSASKQMGKK